MNTFSQRVLVPDPPLEFKVVQGKPQGHKNSKNVHVSHQKTTNYEEKWRSLNALVSLTLVP